MIVVAGTVLVCSVMIEEDTSTELEDFAGLLLEVGLVIVGEFDWIESVVCVVGPAVVVGESVVDGAVVVGGAEVGGEVIELAVVEVGAAAEVEVGAASEVEAASVVAAAVDEAVAELWSVDAVLPEADTCCRLSK